MEDLKYWVWLTLAFGPANYRKWDFVNKFESVYDCYECVQSGDFRGLNSKYTGKVKKATLSQAEKIIDFCDNNGIKIACFSDENYPNALREIDNPPSVIFYYGTLNDSDNTVSIAIIGARKPSEYSVRICIELADELSRIGTTIVSGFALGIDSIAHKTTVLNRSRTIAVLGCGVDYAYPKENSSSKKHLAKFGAVISEYFPGTKPIPEYFRQRNRIISGLSDGVVVVEASNTSGSLNTVSHSLSQGRDVFVFPPSDVSNPRYFGQVSLIRDGATPIFNYYDIVSCYRNKYEKTLGDFEAVDVVKEYEKPRKSKTLSTTESKTTVDNQQKFVDWNDLNDVQTEVMKLLSNGAKTADEIGEHLDYDIGEILANLTELEIFGYISLKDKKYTL